MSLLPTRGPEASARQEGEFEVVGVDEDVAPVLDALASDTARDVLNAIYEEPGTPSELADRLDMSIQKVAYHLEKLEDVDLIDVAGTRYSAKGQEMTVYEPPDDPLVLFVGTEERKSTLRTLVRRVVPTVGILAVASLVVQRLFDAAPAGMTPTSFDGEGGAGGDPNGADNFSVSAESPGAASTQTPQATGAASTSAPQATGAPTPTPQATEMAGTTATTQSTPAMTMADGGDRVVDLSTSGAAESLDPGLAFFLGGLLVLTIVTAVWVYRDV